MMNDVYYLIAVLTGFIRYVRFEIKKWIDLLAIFKYILRFLISWQ
jgi:hypothetical protein